MRQSSPIASTPTADSFNRVKRQTVMNTDTAATTADWMVAGGGVRRRIAVGVG
jgi:hypothetical protein